MRTGLRVQLGHHGQLCPHPQEISIPLTVIDVSGIHSVSYNLCGCPVESGRSLPAYQLLSVGWWPATIVRPQTVVTTNTCKLFHALTLQGKVNMYDFWNGLVRITDGAGLRRVAVCFVDVFSILYSSRCSPGIRSLSVSCACTGICV
jgi:hypothetical protein